MGSKVYALIVALWILTGCDDVTPQEHLSRAESFRSEGEFTSAVIELKNALQKDRAYGPARLELGDLYLATGQYPSAVKELERAFDLGEDPQTVRPLLLQAKLRVGRFSEVLGDLEDMAELSPELMSIKGQALVQADDDLAEAESLFNAALAADPNLPDAYIGLAAIAIRHDEVEKAADLLAQATRTVQPPNRRVWLAKADADLRLARVDEARQDYDQASQLPGNDINPEVGLIRIALLERDFDRAEEILADLRGRAPNNVAVHYFSGVVAHEKGDFESAEQALREVLAQSPNHVPTLLLMGSTAMRLGKNATATSYLGRYVARQPENLAARRMLAATRLSEQDPTGAIEALEPVANRIETAEGLALLGTAYLESGDFARATEFLDRAAEKAPDQAEIRTHLAISLLNTGDDSRAVSELETAVALNPDVIRTEIMLIQARLRQGDVAGARSDAEALADKEPENPAAHNLVGVTALAGGDRAAAAAAFDRAVQLDPGFSPAAVNLARMAVEDGRPEDAASHYENLLAASPDNLAALLGLAELAAQKGHFNELWDYLQRARTQHPAALQPRLAIGSLGLNRNRAEDAADAIREAVSLAPDHPTALLNAAQLELILGNKTEGARHVRRLADVAGAGDTDTTLLLALAEVQLRADMLTNARLTIDRVLAREPDSVNALRDSVRIGLAANDAARARESLDRLAQLDSNKADDLEADVRLMEGRLDEAIAGYRAQIENGDLGAAQRLAAAYYRAEGAEKSIEFMESWLSEHPEDASVRSRAAAMQVTYGDPQKGVQHYERLLEHDPDNWMVANNLAVQYGEWGDRRSIPLARRAYELSGENPEAADTLGWSLLQLGEDGGEALRLLEAAAIALADNATVWYHLAVARERTGAPDGAMVAAERALARGAFPERAAAEALLERLRSAAEEAPS